MLTPRHLRFFVFVLLVSVASVRAHTEAISLAGDWQGGLGAHGKVAVFQSVRLPGSTAEQGLGERNTRLEMGTWSPKLHQEGPVVYRREITIPRSAEGKRLTLFLERTKVTRVWLGDRLIGTHDSLINPHRFDLTGTPPGRHTLSVEVNNDRTLLPVEMTKGVLESHQISAQTQTNWNGIVGRIELQIDEPVSFARVNVYPDLAKNELRARLEIVNITGQARHGEITLNIDPDRGRALRKVTVPFAVAAEHTAANPAIILATVPVPADALTPWSEFTPVLHGFKAWLAVEGARLKDFREVRFGWRAFRADKTQFAINGRKTFLRGETDNAVFPLTGYAPMDAAYHVRELALYRRFGLNHIRFHSWSPPASMLEAADQVGIYMQPELPMWTQIRGDWLGSEKSRDFYTREARDYLLEQGNHPSFVMLALGNELIVNTQRELFDKEKDRLYDFLDLLRGIDSTRLYTEQTGWAAPNPRNDYFSTFGLYNVGDVRSFYQQNTTFNLAAKAVMNPLPLVISEFGQYNMYPDAGREAKKYTGVIDIRNIEEFNRRAVAKGLGPWIPDFERAGSAHAANLYAFESAYYLRTPKLGGYQMLNLKDFPGQGSALCGLLDPFGDVKPGVDPELYRQSAAPVALLASLPNLMLTTAQTLSGDLLVSNYGPGALDGRKIEWRLVDRTHGGKVVAHGVFNPASVPQGDITAAGRFEIPLGEVLAPAQLVIETEIPGLKIADRPVRGTQPVWVYPPISDTPAPAGVLVARSLTSEVVEALRAGRPVLLYPEIKESIIPNSINTHFRFGFWWGGEPMGTLIDTTHPLFRQFPTDDHNDLQWLNLLGLRRDPRSRAMILTGLFPAGHKPIVTVIPTYKRPELLGLVWEANVEKGRLIVASMEVPGQLDKPEVRQLHRALLAYAGSADFKPGVTLTLAQLQGIIRDANARVTTVKSEDPVLRYTGSWTPNLDQKTNEERGRASTQVGASVEWTFDGSGVSVTARKDKLGSSYDVFLDGKRIDRADLYEDTNDGVIQVVWSKFDLPNGRHTLKLVLSEDRHPGSMGPRGWLNKIESFAPPSPTH